MTKQNHVTGSIFDYQHNNPPAPFNPEYDPTSHARHAYVSDLVAMYEKHNGEFSTREERAAYRTKLLEENAHVKTYEIVTRHQGAIFPSISSYTYWLVCVAEGDLVGDFVCKIDGVIYTLEDKPKPTPTLHLSDAIVFAYRDKIITTEEWRFIKDYVEKLLVSSTNFNYSDGGYLQDTIERYKEIQEKCYKNLERYL